MIWKLGYVLIFIIVDLPRDCHEFSDVRDEFDSEKMRFFSKCAAEPRSNSLRDLVSIDPDGGRGVDPFFVR